MNIYEEAIKKLIVQNDYEIIFKVLERAKKVEELLGLYKKVDEFYRKVTRDGDYNAVTILYQQIKALEEEMK